MQDKEMMERYIYEVVRRIPKEQREETALELRELISDMADSGETVEAVLSRLGDPAEFAKQYRDESNVLIGPEYYSDYMWLLKIGLAAAGASAVISGMVHGLMADDFFVEIVSKILGNMITSGIMVFGTITFLFAVFERQKIKVELREKKKWSVDHLKAEEKKDRKNSFEKEGIWHPAQLSPIPDKRAKISRGDSVVSIVCIILMAGLLIFGPQLFGVYLFENDKFVGTISIFNLDKWSMILPVFLTSVLLGLIDEIIRLINGYYCKTVMVSSIALGVSQMILNVILLKGLPLFNPDFAKDVSSQLGLDFASRADLLHYWGTSLVPNTFLAVFLTIQMVEIAVTIYKTVKYGDERSISSCPGGIVS